MGLRRLSAALLISLLTAFTAAGQVYLSGDSPARVRWSHIKTDNYDIIYPSGMDSLARVYGTGLESRRGDIGRSAGYLPNGAYRTRMPVLLHAYTAKPNGMVTWMPRRMELYTGPQAYEPEPLQWHTDLITHESRHVSQMQWPHFGGYKAFSILSGEMFTGVMAALYGGPAFFEGDAVVAETALSTMGRGRSADFLEYFRVTYGSGQKRNWYQWRYGSLNRYTPDYYRVGYMTIAGMRYVYDDALFTEHYYSNIFARKGWFPFFNMSRTVRDDSGMSFRKTWPVIMDAFESQWEANDSLRGPAMQSTAVTQERKYYTSYKSLLCLPDGRLLAVTTSLDRESSLMLVNPADGSARRLSPWASSTSRLEMSPDSSRIYWSESIADIRWGMVGHSAIRYFELKDIDKGRIRMHSLKSGRRLYNPSPAANGDVAVTEYPFAGGSAVVVLDSGGISELARYVSPDSLQVVETAWDGDRLYASGISPAGFGIYEVTDGYRTVLAPAPYKIKQLDVADGRLMYVSDRTTVNELYSLNLSDGKLLRMTNTRFGGSEFAFAGDTLYWSEPSVGGRMVKSSAVADLPVACVEGDSAASRYVIADKLTAQETALAAFGAGAGADSVKLGPVRKYSKLSHALKIHSWLPLYFDYDDISSGSFDSIYQLASLGGTVMFQNTLGSFYGTGGVSVSKNSSGKWTPSAKLHMTSTALYPVFDLTLSYNDRKAYRYSIRNWITADGNDPDLLAYTLDRPVINGKLKVYVPLKFNSGGHLRGIIPQVSYTMTNDTFDLSRVTVDATTYDFSGNVVPYFADYTEGGRTLLQRAALTVRGYDMLSVPTSGIYPRWGIGTETGIANRALLSSNFSTEIYCYLYGYVPGFAPLHGIKLTALAQHIIDGTINEPYLPTAPRGFWTTASSVLAKYYSTSGKITVDYAMPLLPVDWSFLGDAAYIRNFELYLHGDLSGFAGGQTAPGWLYSAGADFDVVLGNIACIPYDTRIGVSWSYSGGSLMDLVTQYCKGRNYFSLIFGIDF